MNVYVCKNCGLRVGEADIEQLREHFAHVSANGNWTLNDGIAFCPKNTCWDFTLVAEPAAETPTGLAPLTDAVCEHGAGGPVKHRRYPSVSHSYRKRSDRASMLGDWRFGAVTVCIAALCDNRKEIVAVSDNKISFGMFSGENMTNKNKPLFGSYFTMMSGNDTALAPTVLATARALMQHYTRSAQALPPHNTAAHLLHDAMRAVLTTQIEAKVLSRFGFTLDSFRREGKENLSDFAYSDIMSEVRSVTLDGLAFLLCGFDDDGDGHIWHVDGVEVPKCYDDVSLWAIGSGQDAALSSLSFHIDKSHLHFPFCDTGQALFAVCAAKFMAESANGVGRSTFVVVHKHDTKSRFIDANGVTIIRNLWEEYGAPRFPAKDASETSLLLHEARLPVPLGAQSATHDPSDPLP